MADVEVTVTPTPAASITLSEPDGAQVEVDLPPQANVVEIAVPGPQGPQGEPGEQGPQGDTYLHEQPVAALLWSITHNLGRWPQVTQIDTSGNRMYGRVIYLTTDELEIHHSAIVSGRATLV